MQATKEQSRIKGFDGLRAIAVTLVFLKHRVEMPGIDLGQLGVWLFFVISGVLIIGILHNQRQSMEAGHIRLGQALKQFFWRRTLRIFPPYYLVLLIAALAIGLGWTRVQATGLLYHVFYLSNLWIGLVLKDWPSLFSHFWSLAVEEQFYLLAAPLLLLTPISTHLRTCLAAFALGIATIWGFRHLGANPATAYTFPLNNFGIIALGGAFYLLTKENKAQALFKGHSMLAACLALIIFNVLRTRWHWEGSPNVETCLNALYILAIGGLVMWIRQNQTSWLVNRLEALPLKQLGKVSYGFYLYHNFIPNLSPEQLAHWLHLNTTPPILVYVGIVASFTASFILAQLSWYGLEQPLQRWKHHFDATPSPCRLAPSIRS